MGGKLGGEEYYPYWSSNRKKIGMSVLRKNHKKIISQNKKDNKSIQTITSIRCSSASDCSFSFYWFSVPTGLPYYSLLHRYSHRDAVEGADSPLETSRREPSRRRDCTCPAVATRLSESISGGYGSQPSTPSTVITRVPNSLNTTVIDRSPLLPYSLIPHLIRSILP